MKSSFLERISLLKVLQELLRPWYKSASSHKPNLPLKKLKIKKKVETFQPHVAHFLSSLILFFFPLCYRQTKTLNHL